jgi:uncharacterized membrane protein YeiB
MTADPGATPVAARALAPDLARGGMLLLIALANVHYYLYDRPVGQHGYPARLGGVDRVVTVLQMSLVDGRAYPLFGFLFGYGIVQLAGRRGAVGLPVTAVTRLVRRRGGWMILIGLGHGVLLWPGDIVGAYGLLAVLMAGLLVGGSDRRLLSTAAVGVGLVTLLYAGSALPVPGRTPQLLPSMTIPDAGPALAARAVEWVGVGLLIQALGVFAAVALGARAARRRLLDEPQRHRVRLRRTAGVGISAAVLGGLPLALVTAGVWTSPPILVLLVAGALHALSGYAGGLGYAALFGLLAIRIAERGRPGAVARAVRACGQRSLSCYLAQSVAFVALLPAWTLGVGAHARVWQAALVGLGTWLVILVIAALSDRGGYRGPAEVVLRRLTYGRSRGPVPA